MKFNVGDQFPAQTLKTVSGDSVSVPDPTKLVHLQFRRFAGCPICNTHIGQLIKHAGKINEAGVKEVLFFHSSADDIRAYQSDVPFDLIADPGKVYYRQVDAETSWFYWMNAKTILAALKSLIRFKFTLKMSGGPFGLPADLLIAPSGRVVAVKYGKSAYDQWSVAELLSLAKSAHEPLPS